jgi:hypothetical protein
MMLIQGSDTVKHDALLRTFWMCAVLLLSSVLHADDKCGVEVKLLLSPGQTEATVASFLEPRSTPANLRVLKLDVFCCHGQATISFID